MSEPKPMPTYWALAEEVTHLHGRLDQLEAENKKLRDENAELRGLVAELYECSRRCGCDRCGFKDGCSTFDRMAQLGIEVSE